MRICACVLVCVSVRGKTKRDWGYTYQGRLRKEMDYSIKD